MVFLILAIISSVMVSIGIRLSEKRTEHVIGMFAVNYLICFLLGWFYSGNLQLLPRKSGIGLALLLGTVNGVLYLGSFILLQMNIKKNGVVLSATFMRLGVLVPTVFSVLAFGEMPVNTQVIGFAIAIVAILMISLEKGQKKADFKIGLIFLLLGSGSADAMSKVYQEIGVKEAENQFLCYTFLMAFILCVFYMIWKKQKIGKWEIVAGVFVGIPNYYSARFLLKALGSVPAVVACPTYSVATIFVISLIGVLCFKERLSKKQTYAMALILIALVFLFLSTS